MTRRRGSRAARSGRDGSARERLLQAGTTDHYVDAALYDYEYEDRSEDVRWYRNVAGERGEGLRILELGAGTGRISSPLARDGHTVIALDAMDSMLQGLRERLEGRAWAHRVLPMRADMRAIPLPDGDVDLVLAPFNTLMHLYGWQDLLACFREAARVLRPGGAFAFDVQIPDLEWLLWDPDVRHAVTRFVHPVTREKMVYSTNHTYDHATQICHIRIYYDDAPPNGRRFVPPAEPRRLVHLAHRQIFPEELRMLVAMAGLQLEQLDGDFVGKPLRDAKESQVAVCVKPE
ncbi:MAG TPA: class I SAM-dependent methyltransferase [Nannocystaceae bacterium]|nr:class I SAM-dependent methyltransferase [Nannocystaceae bacterium]